MKTVLTPVADIPAFAVIIRAIHERGPEQAAAIRELFRRRLWLAPDQIAATGLAPEEYGQIYNGAEAR